MSTKEQKKTNRVAARHAGSSNFAHAAAGADARPCHHESNRVQLRRRFAGRTGVALSRAAPAHQEEMDLGRGGTSENNRRAKFYRLTAKGRRQLVVETSKWDKLAGAIARILRPTEQGVEQEGKP